MILSTTPVILDIVYIYICLQFSTDAMKMYMIYLHSHCRKLLQKHIFQCFPRNDIMFLKVSCHQDMIQMMDSFR